MRIIKTIKPAYKPLIVFFNDSDDETRQKLIERLGIFIEADEDKYDAILSRYSQDGKSPMYCGAVAGEIIV